MLAERLRSQLLAGNPAAGPVEVAEHLLAIQGQDQRGARLAIRARTHGLHVSDVDRALTEDRTLLITWLNRGTLHLVSSQDYPLLQALTTPQLRQASARRLEQVGVGPAEADRGVRVVSRALESEGPLVSHQLRERLDSAGIETAGQALVHILLRTCLDGLAVRGPMVDGKHAYVLVRDWLGEPPPVDRERGLAELARRFLVGHGPADDRDLAKWAGITLRDARAGLSANAGALVERRGLVDVKRPDGATPKAPARLLGAFDPVLHGWRSRAELLGAGEAEIILGGVFRPFALARSRAAGLWKLVAGKVELQPFGPLPRADAAALEADARDVECFLAPAGV